MPPRGRRDGTYRRDFPARCRTRGGVCPERHSTALGRLTSYHEAVHAFLNSSTNFGCAMIKAGAISNAGYPEHPREIDSLGQRRRCPAKLAGPRAPCRWPLNPIVIERIILP